MMGAWATHWAGHAGGRDDEGEDGGRGLTLMQGGVGKGEEEESEEEDEEEEEEEEVEEDEVH